MTDRVSKINLLSPEFMTARYGNGRVVLSPLISVQKDGVPLLTIARIGNRLQLAGLKPNLYDVSVELNLPPTMRNKGKLLACHLRIGDQTLIAGNERIGTNDDVAIFCNWRIRGSRPVELAIEPAPFFLKSILLSIIRRR